MENEFDDAKVFTSSTAVAEIPEAAREIIPSNNNELMLRAEIDTQIATAKMYPRNLKKAKSEAFEMATIDQETAEGCFYNLPRAGNNIQGPSVRLAEIFNYAWGNVRAGARVVAIDRDFVVAQGVHHDLERNTFTSIEVKRRITDKYGKRYKDDMISVAANAACSIAYRNATFKNIPRIYVDSVYRAAKKAAVGDITTLSERRLKCIEHFAKMGVREERLFESIGVSSIEEIGLDELEKLIGLSSAIKNGDTTIDEAFPEEKPKLTGSNKALEESDQKKKAGKKTTPAVEETELPFGQVPDDEIGKKHGF